MVLLSIRFTVLLLIVFAGPFIDALFDGIKKESKSFSYSLILNCDEQAVYPLRFLLIFLLDTISATIDLIIFIAAPRIENKRQRVKQTRVEDINQTIIRNKSCKQNGRAQGIMTQELEKGSLYSNSSVN